MENITDSRIVVENVCNNGKADSRKWRHNLNYFQYGNYFKPNSN